MSKYTVVLLRPKCLSEENYAEYGQDIYVAIGIEASDVVDAVKKAQKEVYACDKKEEAYKGILFFPEMYKLCVLFEGTHNPKLFGWQAH